MAKSKKKEKPVNLGNMSFEDALKKALNTPLPKDKKSKKEPKKPS